MLGFWRHAKEPLEREPFKIFLLGIIFMAIHFFSSNPYHFVAMDTPRNLQLVKTFPSYVCFNNMFYDSHPPLHTLVIRIFGSFLSDHIAGILVSQLSSLGVFLVGWLFLKSLRTPARTIFVALIFFTFSWQSYYWSNLIYKETFFVLLTFSYLYLFFRVITTGTRRYVTMASVVAVFLALTSDLVISLFPISLVVLFLWKGNIRQNSSKLKVVLPIILAVLAYGGWIWKRYTIYSHYQYYPAGIDGHIEEVGKFNFINLISPRTFPNSSIPYDIRISTRPFHYVRYVGSLINLVEPFHLSSDNFSSRQAPILLIYLVIIYSMVRGIMITIRRKCKAGIFLLFCVLIFLSPVICEACDARFSFNALILLGYFVGVGIGKMDLRKLRPIFIAALAGFLIFWLVSHPFFFGFLEKEVHGKKTAEFVNNLPEDGIMSEYGSGSIPYLTGKRVIRLPVDLSTLDKQIEQFGINYLVVEKGSRNDNYFIKHEGEFRFLKEIEESYRSTIMKEKIRIYEVSYEPFR